MLVGTKSWLKQTLTIHPHSAFNSNGQSTYSTSTTTPCQIIQKNVNTMDATGSEVISTTQILIDGAVTITALDKIVLPDGTQPHIHAIHTVNNPVTGTAYYKIIFT